MEGGSSGGDRRRQENEVPKVSWTVDLEISLVGGENPMDALALRDPHDSGIREVHRQVVVFGHQFPHTRDVVTVERCDFDDSSCEKSH